MSDTIIKAEGVGKKYRIRHEQPERYTALRDVIAGKVRNAFQIKAAYIKKASSDRGLLGPERRFFRGQARRCYWNYRPQWGWKIYAAENSEPYHRAYRGTNRN